MKTKNEKSGTLSKIRLSLTLCSMFLFSGLATAQDNSSVQTLIKSGSELTRYGYLS